jgi:hypothetical protein
MLFLPRSPSVQSFATHPTSTRPTALKVAYRPRRVSTFGKSGQTARQGSRISSFCRRSLLAVTVSTNPQSVAQGRVPDAQHLEPRRRYRRMSSFRRVQSQSRLSKAPARGFSTSGETFGMVVAALLPLTGAKSLKIYSCKSDQNHREFDRPRLKICLLQGRAGSVPPGAPTNHAAFRTSLSSLIVT